MRLTVLNKIKHKYFILWPGTKPKLTMYYFNLQYAELFISMVELAAIVLIPLICVGLTIWSQKRYANQQLKGDLFQKLFLYRASPVFKKEFVDALNAIQVVFPKNKKVRASWVEFHNLVTTNGRELTEDEKKQLSRITSDILFEITKEVKIKNVQREDFDKLFYPLILGQEEVIDRENKRLLHDFYTKSSASEAQETTERSEGTQSIPGTPQQ
jgi:hypothetical protein